MRPLVTLVIYKYLSRPEDISLRYVVGGTLTVEADALGILAIGTDRTGSVNNVGILRVHSENSSFHCFWVS